MKISELLKNFLNLYSGKYNILEIYKIFSGIYQDDNINVEGIDVNYINILPSKNNIYFKLKKIIKNLIDDHEVIEFNKKLYSKKNYKKMKQQEEQIKNQKCFLNSLSEKYGFEGFIHTAAFENFINIMQDGFLYSRNKIENSNKKHIETALHDVMEHTEDSVKNNVRFYWRTKTPTNYRNEGIKSERILTDPDWEAHSPIPVIMIFDSSIAFENNVSFSNGNCGSSKSTIFTNFDDVIEKTNWEYVFHNGPIEGNYAITRVKQAELLFPNEISTNFIKKIVFRSRCDKERAERILGQNNKFCINSDYFHNDFLYIKDYNYDSTLQKLSVAYNLGNEFFNKKSNLLEYKHSIKMYANNGAYKIYSLNNVLKSLEPKQDFIIPISKEIDYFCYNIDDIECIRVDIND